MGFSCNMSYPSPSERRGASAHPALGAGDHDGRVVVRAVKVLPSARQRRARRIALAVVCILTAAGLSLAGRARRDADLMLAAQAGDSRAVRTLLAQGANAGARTAEGASVLETAAARGHTRVVAALLDAGRPSQPALVPAALRGQSEVVKYLLARGASATGEQAGPLLCAAAQSGDLPTLRAVLPVSGSAAAAASALEWRATNPGEEGMTPVMFAARSGRAGVVFTLLKHGADPRARSRSGRTLLMFAAVWNGPDLCSFLVRNGAAVDDRDEEGRTALMLAASAGNRAAVDYLLKAGASPNIEDAQGKTALALARESGDAKTVNRLRAASAR